jgi:hypothetical protein
VIIIKENSKRIGEENYNTFGTLMRIVEYVTTDNIIVEFQDEYKYKKRTQYCNFKSGSVKNPYDKIVFGVACLGDGKYGSWKDSRNDKGAYLAWTNMLLRCYVDLNGKASSYYNIVTVCDEWMNFQNFAQWYEDNYYEIPNEKLHIDKDIKFKNNKVYSPDTCILIPQKINEMFRDNSRKKTDSDLPVTIRRCKNGYKVRFRNENLGIYKTINECLDKYNKKKIDYIRKLVKGYGDLLPIEIKNILLQWKP